MGPRIFIRGNWSAEAFERATVFASMGPRIFIRGNADCAERVLLIFELQWGRGSSSAETGAQARAQWGATGLQWGRGSSSAETPHASTCALPWMTLQWGRGSSSAETRDTRIACSATE